ncbi:MAG: hypothetical protein HFI24_06200, partial [Lachnospiraceae bacterium]|nr:hypothetical protein [Lachnospiraceae bacterium]
ENVLIGKLIPAGTGMKRYQSVKLDTELKIYDDPEICEELEEEPELTEELLEEEAVDSDAAEELLEEGSEEEVIEETEEELTEV